jgi:hypothetical protein
MKLNCPHLSQFHQLTHGFFAGSPEILTTEQGQSFEALTGTLLPLVTLKQVHGDKVIHVTEPLKAQVEGDGLVTRCKGIALGILTADCGPLLFYDPVAGVIGACHAGWRGARLGIIQATLIAMEDQGAERGRIHAILGPTIQQMSYEVGPEFPSYFQEADSIYFRPSPKQGHHYFDLPQYIIDQLIKEKIAQIHDLKQNTFIGKFESRRRSLSKRQDKSYHCNLSAIAII